VTTSGERLAEMRPLAGGWLVGGWRKSGHLLVVRWRKSDHKEVLRKKIRKVEKLKLILRGVSHEECPSANASGKKKYLLRFFGLKNYLSAFAGEEIG